MQVVIIAVSQTTSTGTGAAALPGAEPILSHLNKDGLEDMALAAAANIGMSESRGNRRIDMAGIAYDFTKQPGVVTTMPSNSRTLSPRFTRANK